MRKGVLVLCQWLLLLRALEVTQNQRTNILTSINKKETSLVLTESIVKPTSARADAKNLPTSSVSHPTIQSKTSSKPDHYKTQTSHHSTKPILDNVTKQDWPIYDDFPISLRFVEHLKADIRSSDILIFTGGDKIQRRLEGFGKISADSIKAFAELNGYQLVFLDQLDYNKNLTYKGDKFHPAWSRVFALPGARKAYPNVKYIVWFDDDIIVPHPETHMLNHFINLMHDDEEWLMAYAEEGRPYILNSGMFIMKNCDFSHGFYQKVLDRGSETGWKFHFGWEQDGVKDVRIREKSENHVRIIPHRHDEVYNWNTFPRILPCDPPGTRAFFGDAFVHYCGHTDRAPAMREWMSKVDAWKQKLPKGYPIPFSMLEHKKYPKYDK